MSDYSFETNFTIPHDGSLIADTIRSASKEYARRCFHEAYAVESVSDLDEDKQAAARVFLQEFYERALNNLDIPDKIIKEWDKAEEDLLSELDEPE